MQILQKKNHFHPFCNINHLVNDCIGDRAALMVRIIVDVYVLVIIQAGVEYTIRLLSNRLPTNAITYSYSKNTKINI